jgi:hypothetical protein
VDVMVAQIRFFPLSTVVDSRYDGRRVGYGVYFEVLGGSYVVNVCVLRDGQLSGSLACLMVNVEYKYITSYLVVLDGITHNLLHCYHHNVMDSNEYNMQIFILLQYTIVLVSTFMEVLMTARNRSRNM